MTKSEEINKEFLTQTEVLKKLGIGRTSLYKLRKSGKFAKPALESPLRWRAKDIDKFCDRVVGL